jgi:hypothetical protein
MAQDFSLMPNYNRSAYFLKREGERGNMEFASFTSALAYARSCPESSQSMVIFFDPFGQETMRFSARLPQKTFATPKDDAQLGSSD